MVHRVFLRLIRQCVPKTFKIRPHCDEAIYPLKFVLMIRWHVHKFIWKPLFRILLLRIVNNWNKCSTKNNWQNYNIAMWRNTMQSLNIMFQRTFNNMEKCSWCNFVTYFLPHLIYILMILIPLLKCIYYYYTHYICIYIWVYMEIYILKQNAHIFYRKNTQMIYAKIMWYKR